MTNCTDQRNGAHTSIQFLVVHVWFQLSIWHFFVLTQKSTQKKSRQKDASSRVPSHPRLFVGPAHLSFNIKCFLRDLVSADWILFFLIRCNLSCTQRMITLLMLHAPGYRLSFQSHIHLQKPFCNHAIIIVSSHQLKCILPYEFQIVGV